MIVKEDVYPAVVMIATPDNETLAEELRAFPPTEGALRVPDAKVIVTDSRILIVVDSPGNPDPLIKFSQAIDTATHVKNKGAVESYVTTLSGIKLAWVKDSNCGCGSRLKSWNPFRHLGSVKDPTE